MAEDSATAGQAAGSANAGSARRRRSRRRSRSARCSRPRSSSASSRTLSTARASTPRWPCWSPALGVLAIAYAIALFARRYQGAGAVYEYLTRGAHPSVGIFAAGIFFVGTLFLGGGGIYLGLGILTQGFWVAHISTSTCPPGGCFALLFLALVLVLNYLGVRIAIGAMLTFAAISFTPMLFLALDDHRQGRGRTGTPCRLQPRHDLGARRLQRRAARHPALRRLRGGRLDRRGEPRSRTVRSRARFCGRWARRRCSS